MTTLNTTPLETASDGFDSTYEVFTVTIDGHFFEWHGGAYIDVSTSETSAVVIDVLNVWDYEKDAPRILPNQEEFVCRCANYLFGNDEG
jgi:hypothetical protein